MSDTSCACFARVGHRKKSIEELNHVQLGIKEAIRRPSGNGDLFGSRFVHAESLDKGNAAPFTAVPEALRDVYDERKSPLIFRDGRRVKDHRDWAERREEIRREWFEIIGQWPAIIEHPRIDILETIHREGIVQHKVRVQIARQQP